MDDNGTPALVGSSEWLGGSHPKRYEGGRIKGGCSLHAADQRRSVTPWFPVAVDPVHEGIYEVEYRQSRFLFRREWRDGVWCIPGAVMLPATRPKRWRGLTAPARTMPKDQR